MAGREKADEFRTKAVEFGLTTGFIETSLALQLPETHSGQPLEARINIGNAQIPVAPSCWEPGDIAGEFEVLSALRGLQMGKDYLVSASLIPDGIAMKLKKILPTMDALLPFLQHYSFLFEVALLGQDNRNNKETFTFKVIKTSTMYWGQHQPLVVTVIAGATRTFLGRKVTVRI